MKQFLWIALLVVTSVTGVRTAAAQAAGETPTPDSLRIDRFMRLNDQGDFTGALGMLPPSLQGKVTTEMLSRVWTRATYSIGSYRRIVRIREDIRDTKPRSAIYRIMATYFTMWTAELWGGWRFVSNAGSTAVRRMQSPSFLISRRCGG